MPDLRLKFANADIERLEATLGELGFRRIIVEQHDHYFNMGDQVPAMKLRHQHVVEQPQSAELAEKAYRNPETGEYMNLAAYTGPRKDSYWLISYRAYPHDPTGAQYAAPLVLAIPTQDQFDRFQKEWAHAYDTSIKKTRVMYGGNENGINVFVHADTFHDDILEQEWPRVIEIEVKYANASSRGEAGQVMQTMREHLGLEHAQPAEENNQQKKRHIIRNHPILGKLLIRRELDDVGTHSLESVLRAGQYEPSISVFDRVDSERAIDRLHEIHADPALRAEAREWLDDTLSQGVRTVARLSQQRQLESMARSALRRAVDKIPGVNKAIEAVENRRGRRVS
jgi:hypothetical protein